MALWAYLRFMDWQQLVSLGIVAAAAALLAWGKFHRRRWKWQEQTHCGCAGVAGDSVSKSTIVFRASKGRRPEVHVKMR